MNEAPLRIECFDISNLQGTQMVASMVVFEDGVPKKSEYRRFEINLPENGTLDDTAAINQVLTRRLNRLKIENDLDENDTDEKLVKKFAYKPQLIIVDGGKPQVSAAARALEGFDIAFCGIAKRLEEVWLPNQKDPIIFPRNSEAMYLVQRIRDEAHRFAITYHRSKRSKAMLESTLEDIPGLGQARARALITHFGSVAKLKAASEEQVAQLPGIGIKLAKVIVEYLADPPVTGETSVIAGIDMATGEILDSRG
jgi:excinuclease ABC subunit C